MNATGRRVTRLKRIGGPLAAAAGASLLVALCVGAYTSADAGPRSHVCGPTGVTGVSGVSGISGISGISGTTYCFPGGNQLTVGVAGGGAGSVSYASLVCPPDCVSYWSGGQTATLTAQAAGGSQLGGWAGCDSVAGNVCSILMDDDKAVTATFNAAPPPPNAGSGGSGQGSDQGAGKKKKCKKKKKKCKKKKKK